MTTHRRAGLLLAYAGVTFLSFPQPLGDFVLDLGPVLSWLSPALLMATVEGLPPLRAARWAFVAGLAAHSAILHWIYVVTVVYGHAPLLVGLLAPVALAAYMALFPAIFGGSWARLRGLPAAPFVAATLWTVCDHFRSFALTGFPWATLGYAQGKNTALLPLAGITGVYGLCFVTALGGAALFCGVRALRRGAGPDRWVGAALAVVIGVHIGGIVALLREAEPETRTLRVAVLQGNIDQGVKWSDAWADRTLSIYESLSREAAAQGAEVIVWPETAIPGSIEGDPRLRERLVSLARETRAAFVVGAVGAELAPGATRPDLYDSAALLGPAGFTDRYDKSHLVPYGEYVPLRDLLGAVLSAVARGIAQNDVSRGAGPRPVFLEPGTGETVTAGVPICYELLFPDLVRRFVRDGAEVLFAITNDAWYGRTGAPHQFLAITAMRSAETRVWTARAANTGVSAIIDARGRVRARTRIFERDLLVHDVPLRPRPVGGSFYTRHGDVFAGACWLSAAGAFLVDRRRRSRKGRGET